MPEKTKKILAIIGAIAMVAVAAYMMLTSDLKHIEDTNGPDDYSLTTITDQQILDMDMGALGLGRSTSSLTSTVKFDSNKFTGVEEIMWTDVLFSSGFTMDILDYKVHSGNFKMVVINEGEIIAELTPEDEFPVNLGDLKGHVSLVIAGESADFSFKLFESDYDSYAHRD